MGNEDKVRENALRRAAARQGLTLRKTRRLDTRATDYGTWAVIHTATGVVQREGLSVWELERYLDGPA